MMPNSVSNVTTVRTNVAKNVIIVPAWFRVALLTFSAYCGAALGDNEVPPDGSDASEGWQANYEKKSLEIISPGGGWIFEPALRLQFRYSDPFDEPQTADDAREQAESDYELNRARFKIDAQLGAESLTLYTETELDGPVLLDLRVTYEPSDVFGIRVGQWKPEYNRERRDSSGAQTFVDRSIVNREFTIDRQQGAMLFGRAEGGGPTDFSWWTGVFGGGGRGSGNDGGELMYMARLQWNPFGRVLGFSQSDLNRRPEPAGSVAVAAVRNRSRYTRFSSDGGGELAGFERGEVDQYEIEQWVIETALQWRGFAWQQEWHRKDIHDRVAGGETRLEGFYAQASYFPSAAWSAWPQPLELGFRYAVVDPDTAQSADQRDEYTVVANWFFHGHRNKLTLDYARLDFDEPTGQETAWRTRLQWDVSF